MMPSLPLTAVAPILLFLSTSTTAYPASAESRSLAKRGANPESIGLGFGITIAIIVFGIIVFYLGVRRGQTGTWFCWRDPIPSRSPTALSEKISVIDPDQVRSRISCPIPLHSSTLIELSPVESYKPKFLELEAATENVIYEMGEPPTPRRPASAMTRKSFWSSRTDVKSGHYSMYSSAKRQSMKSVKSSRKSMDRKSIAGRRSCSSERPPMPTRQSWFGRQSWFCKSAAEVEEERRDELDNDSENEDGALPEYPGPALVRTEARTVIVVNENAAEGKPESQKRKTKRVESGMDWTGMEWLKKAYAERKSVWGLRSVHPRE